MSCTHMCNCNKEIDIDVVLKSEEQRKKLKIALQEIDFDSFEQHFDDDGDEI